MNPDQELKKVSLSWVAREATDVYADDKWRRFKAERPHRAE